MKRMSVKVLALSLFVVGSGLNAAATKCVNCEKNAIFKIYSDDEFARCVLDEACNNDLKALFARHGIVKSAVAIAPESEQPKLSEVAEKVETSEQVAELKDAKKDLEGSVELNAQKPDALVDEASLAQ